MCKSINASSSSWSLTGTAKQIPMSLLPTLFLMIFSYLKLVKYENHTNWKQQIHDIFLNAACAAAGWKKLLDIGPNLGCMMQDPHGPHVWKLPLVQVVKASRFYHQIWKNTLMKTASSPIFYIYHI